MLGAKHAEKAAARDEEHHPHDLARDDEVLRPAHDAATGGLHALRDVREAQPASSRSHTEAPDGARAQAEGATASAPKKCVSEPMEPWTDSGPGRESIDSARSAAAAEPFDDAEPVAKPWQPRNNAEKLKMSHLERRGIETVTSRLLSPDDVALPRAPRPSHVPRMRGVLVDEDAERARVMRLERMRAQLALPVRACCPPRPEPLSNPNTPSLPRSLPSFRPFVRASSSRLYSSL